MKLYELLKGKKVIVTVGFGGVGKTTTAAAIGLYYAIIGHKVIVVTVDPARRLATALGLEAMGGKPQSIDLTQVHNAPKGTFDIVMLDAEEVFKSIIDRFISDEDLRNKLASNRFFRRFTEAMSGTQEQAAVEKLYELTEGGKYDIIVLDTPPARLALEFLNSPRRMIEVLDDSVLRFLISPATETLGVFSFGSRYISKILSMFAGAEMLSQLAGFMSLLSGQMGGFKERAKAVEALLTDKRTTYLIVASPESHAISGASMFYRALKDGGFKLGGVIFNRANLTPYLPTTADSLRRQLKEKFPNFKFPQGFEKRLFPRYMHETNVARIHKTAASEIKKSCPDLPVFLVPALDDEICDLKGVFAMSRAIFTSEGS